MATKCKNNKNIFLIYHVWYISTQKHTFLKIVHSFVHMPADSQLSRSDQVLITADHATNNTCTKFNYFKCWLTVFFLFSSILFSKKLHYSNCIIITKSCYGCHSEQTDRYTNRHTNRQADTHPQTESAWISRLIRHYNITSNKTSNVSAIHPVTLHYLCVTASNSFESTQTHWSFLDLTAKT